MIKDPHSLLVHNFLRYNGIITDAQSQNLNFLRLTVYSCVTQVHTVYKICTYFLGAFSCSFISFCFFVMATRLPLSCITLQNTCNSCNTGKSPLSDMQVQCLRAHTIFPLILGVKVLCTYICTCKYNYA